MPGTLITAAWANTTMNDLAQAITDSLDRQGRGGMNAALRVAGGTNLQPAFSFTGATQTGMYSSVPGLLEFSVLGTKIAEFSSTGLALVTGKSISADVLVLNTTLSLALGSAVAPSLSFQGDPDTGLFSPTSNQVALTVGGATQINIEPGEVRIPNSILRVFSGAGSWFSFGANTSAVSAGVFYAPGTTTPIGYLGTGGGGISSGPSSDFGIRSEAALTLMSGAAEHMRIDATGQVAIATAIPTAGYKLTVAGDTQIKGFHLSLTDIDGTNPWFLTRDNAVTGNFQILSAGPTSRLDIAPGGNVGINVGNPQSALHVKGYTAEAVRVDSPGNTYVAFLQNGSASGYVGSAALVGGAATDFTVRAENGLILGAGGANQHLRITSAGVVTITNAPPAADNSLRVPTTEWVNSQIAGQFGRQYLNVLGSRSLDTAFATGAIRPLLVSISYVSPPSAELQGQINTGAGFVVVTRTQNSLTSSQRYSISMYVPVNAQYRFVQITAGSSVDTWAEMS